MTNLTTTIMKWGSGGGNAVTTAEVDGKPITIGLNAYIKP
jgi:hypothetical protein